MGTPLADGKETRTIDGRDHVLEYPLHADFALVKAERADRWGNLTYRLAARNFAPLMCMAAATTIVQARELVELGGIDPETVVTPGIFVDRVVAVPQPMSEREAISRGTVTRDRGLTRNQVAWRIAQDIPDGAFVNLGIASRCWWRISCLPSARWCFTARTGSSAWAPSRRATTRTRT